MTCTGQLRVRKLNGQRLKPSYERVLNFEQFLWQSRERLDELLGSQRKRRMAKASIFASRISLVTSALFLTILVGLHFLRPDLDPSWRFISEYEIGDYGWLMRVAFFLLATSCASLCVGIFPYARTVTGWLGMSLLVISCGGMILAGIYIPDKTNKLHEYGAMLDNVPFAALLINWSLSQHPQWSSSKRTLATTAGLPLIGLILFIGSLAWMLPKNGGQPGPNVLAGWPNRVFVLAHLAWLVPIATRTLAISTERESLRMSQ